MPRPLRQLWIESSGLSSLPMMKFAPLGRMPYYSYSKGNSRDR
jgi:hypothetical protein